MKFFQKGAFVFLKSVFLNNYMYLLIFTLLVVILMLAMLALQFLSIIEPTNLFRQASVSIKQMPDAIAFSFVRPGMELIGRASTGMARNGESWVSTRHRLLLQAADSKLYFCPKFRWSHGSL